MKEAKKQIDDPGLIDDLEHRTVAFDVY